MAQFDGFENSDLKKLRNFFKKNKIRRNCHCLYGTIVIQIILQKKLAVK